MELMLTSSIGSQNCMSNMSCNVPLKLELWSGLVGARWGATDFKAWSMYYQVISDGRQPTLPMDTSREFR